MVNVVKNDTSVTTDKLGMWYLQQAMDFERSKTQDARYARLVAWRCFAGAMALVGITVVTSAVLVHQNKPNPPAIMRVNDLTGDVTILKSLVDGKITYGQATDIKYLRDYVNYRESYDWETIQDLYNATILLSNSREGNVYAAANSDTNKSSPVNVLKDKVRVIAKAGTVSFVGKTALVSFTKRIVGLNGMPPAIEYFVATIAYEYENAPLDDKDRGINVAGFKVTSYHVVRDFTKTSSVPADASLLAGARQ